MTYIDPAGKVHAALTRKRLVQWDDGGQPAPITLEVDLSNRCPLGCQACHFAHTHVKGPWVNRLRMFPNGYDGTGDLADPLTTMRWLTEARAAGVQGIVWSGGGEPTTHPHWLNLLSYAHRLGFQQGMYTLGGLLNPTTGAAAGAALTWAVVSLDCIDADTYATEKGVPPSRFNAACDGIRSLVGHGAVVGVSFLLHAQNWLYMERMAAFGLALGADYVTFRPTIETSPANPNVLLGDWSWVNQAIPRLKQLARDPRIEVSPDRFEQWAGWHGHGYDTCYGVRLNATITPDSRVWVCVNRRGVPGSCIGDLTTESFADVWARHPGQWMVDRDCRAMCRLHPVNQQLDAIYQPRTHEAFI